MGTPKHTGRLLFLLLGGASVSCEHLQTPGDYALTVDQVQRDECNLLGTPAPSPFLSGHLRIAGNSVWMDYALDGIQLVGRYIHLEESATLDGSAANIQTSVNGQACQVDEVNVHLDYVSDDARHLHGNLRVQFTTLAASACACQMRATYHAVLQP